MRLRSSKMKFPVQPQSGARMQPTAQESVSKLSYDPKVQQPILQSRSDGMRKPGNEVPGRQKRNRPSPLQRTARVSTAAKFSTGPLSRLFT